MGQVTSGVRSILSLPEAYNGLQNLLGGSKARKIFVKDYLGLRGDERLLDIGCGTAELLDYLPEGIRYFGFDASEEYIQAAKKRFGSRGQFTAKLVSDAALNEYHSFERIVAYGLLHHLDDEEAIHLFRVAKEALSKDGKFVTFDNCYVTGQSYISKALTSMDRGKNVRNPDEYLELAKTVFERVHMYHRNDLLRIPYDHIILVCN